MAEQLAAALREADEAMRGCEAAMQERDKAKKEVVDVAQERDQAKKEVESLAEACIPFTVINIQLLIFIVISLSNYGQCRRSK